MHQPPIPHVARTDPAIADLIEHEARREFEKIRLIPSENYVSEALTPQGIGGKPAARALDRAGLELNYNTVP